MTEPTARPWRVNEDLEIISKDRLVAFTGGYSSSTMPMVREEHIANARLIVRAVNNFDDLLKTLGNMVVLANPLFSDAPQRAAIAQARAVIKKAEAQP